MWMGIFSCNSDDGFLQLMMKVTANCTFLRLYEQNELYTEGWQILRGDSHCHNYTPNKFPVITQWLNTAVLIENEISCPYTVKLQFKMTLVQM